MASVTDDVSAGTRPATAIVGEAEFEALAEEWDQLALRTGSTPFCRPGWIGPWWRAFGAGELLLVTCRRDGALTGVLPLGRRRGLLRGCANVHSGLFDVVAADDTDAEALLRLALRQGRGVSFERLEGGGRLASAARRVAGEAGCRVETLATVPASQIAAGGSWEDYEAGLKSKRRSNNRRIAKRLAKLGEVGVRQAEDADGIGALFEDFLRLEANPWKLERGTAIRQSAAQRDFYEQVIRWGVADGSVRLVLLTLDERPVAAQLSIDGKGRRFGLKIGFDEELSRYSPGLFLQLREIRRSLEVGLSFDMGTGDEPLKRELRSAAWEMETLALFPRSAGGRLARMEAMTRAKVRGRANQSRALRRGRDLLRRRRAQRYR
jgi:CelD/BcsL family acetyltransferase involved in cellulose biosynthesis